MNKPVRKALLLAGGLGTRLYPVTIPLSKHLLPVYDKPMIYYPLWVLMLAGLNEVLIIAKPEDIPQYRKLLGDGNRWGIQLHYAAQSTPGGIAEALLIGEDFIGDHLSVLILGDNLFYGTGLKGVLQAADQQHSGATVLLSSVKDPQHYGILTLDQQGLPVSIAEKPLDARSNLAVTGLYFYDQQAVTFARSLRKSQRLELEITDLNRLYLNQGQLHYLQLSDSERWFDTGTHPAVLAAANAVCQQEQQSGHKIGCPEAAAFEQGWIDREQLFELAQPLIHTDYGKYLRFLANGEADENVAD